METRELEKLRQFMVFSRAASTLSKDRSTKLGAVILGQGFEVRAMGYNGFPRGVNDEAEERHLRPVKYKYTEHAERNAIYNAARVGTPLEGCRLLLDSPIFVCSDCARAIINVGIRQVILIRRGDPDSDRQQRWEEDEVIARTMFAEAGVDVVYITEDEL